MPMNGTTLATAIETPLKTEIKTQISAFYSIGADTFSQDQLDKFASALAKGVANILGPKVVEHIQNNAVVSSTVTVTSVSGVTTGGGVSGPGTGTATGTIA